MMYFDQTDDNIKLMNIKIVILSSLSMATVLTLLEYLSDTDIVVSFHS